MPRPVAGVVYIPPVGVPSQGLELRQDALSITTSGAIVSEADATGRDVVVEDEREPRKLAGESGALLGEPAGRRHQDRGQQGMSARPRFACFVGERRGQLGVDDGVVLGAQPVLGARKTVVGEGRLGEHTVPHLQWGCQLELFARLLEAVAGQQDSTADIGEGVPPARRVGPSRASPASRIARASSEPPV